MSKETQVSTVAVPVEAWNYANTRLKGLHGLRLEGEPKPIDNSKFFTLAMQGGSSCPHGSPHRGPCEVCDSAQGGKP